jgi:hypothetical protein
MRFYMYDCCVLIMCITIYICMIICICVIFQFKISVKLK